jgi:predicted nucleotide-binding protein
VRIEDLQFVAHVFAPADGPDADAAYRAVEEIWRDCGLLFQMTDSIPGTGLPHLLAGSRDGLPAGGEVELAARERPGANCQAVLRLHHDVLNLSVALARADQAEPADQAGTAGPGDAVRSSWRTFGRQWSMLVGRHSPHLLGEARLYLARVEAGQQIRAVSPALYTELSGLLPDAEPRQSRSTGVAIPPDLAFWEIAPEPDDRVLRRFVLAFGPDADAAASAWVWSRGDTAIPPLARYLLHAAKLRYEMRVWRSDSQARELRTALESLSEEFRRLGGSDPAKERLLQLHRLDAKLLHADLRDLRHSVEIAADNLGRAFDLSGLLSPGSAFADDAVLAQSMLEGLDDEVAYLGVAAERAELIQRARIDSAGHDGTRSSARAEGPAVSTPANRTALDDLSRNVFVVYGRDESARRAIFEFLRAIGLRPLEWETVVRATEKAAPSLSEAVRTGLAMTRAVVVLMTPEDVVRLHPDLHQSHESEAETKDSLQARPNVLLELGMALAAHPNGTLVLMFGDHRPVTDLGGINFIRVSDTPDCRRKIAGRLQQAGCPVDDSGQDWLSAGNFAALTALSRRPTAF